MTQPTRTTIGATASGSRLSKHFLAAVVAASSASLLAAHSASADIIYSGVINFACAVDIDGCYINVETGLLSNGPGTGVPGWDVNPYSTSGGMNFFNSTGGGQMRRPAVTTGTAGNLALNTAVVSTGSYNTGTGNVYGTTSATGLLGGWTYSSENIIGFKFVAAAGTTHYGWMRFAMGAAGSSGTSMTRTVVDYAWETTAGLPILAGNQGGPPPAYDPCASFNPTVSVGINNVGMNSTTATDLALDSCGTAYKANYFKFVAPVDGAYGFNACAQSGVRFAILDGCAVGSSVLACSGSCSAAMSMTAGQTVYCVAGGESAGTVLTSPLNIVVIAPAVPACSGATVAVFGDNAFDDTAATTPQVVQTNAANTTVATIQKATWFKFTAGATGAYSFSLCGSTGDTMMGIGTVCPTVGTTFQTLAYNDDAPSCSSGGTSNLASFIDATNGGATGTFAGFPLTQDLVSGQTYYIVAGSFSATANVTSTLRIDGPPQTGSCIGDLNLDGVVNGADLGLMLGAWGACPGGTPGCLGDLNLDGVVTGADLGLLLGAWGACP
jgi:hypothetical protein